MNDAQIGLIYSRNPEEYARAVKDLLSRGGWVVASSHSYPRDSNYFAVMVKQSVSKNKGMGINKRKQIEEESGAVSLFFPSDGSLYDRNLSGASSQDAEAARDFAKNYAQQVPGSFDLHECVKSFLAGVSYGRLKGKNETF